MNYNALLKNMAKLIYHVIRKVRMIIKILAETYFKHELLRQFILNETQQKNVSISEKKRKANTFTRQVYINPRVFHPFGTRGNPYL